MLQQPHVSSLFLFLVIYLLGSGLLNAKLHQINGIQERLPIFQDKSRSWLHNFVMFLPASHDSFSDNQLYEFYSQFCVLDSQEYLGEYPAPRAPTDPKTIYAGHDWKYSLQYTNYPDPSNIYPIAIGSVSDQNDSFVFLFGGYNNKIPKQNIPNLGSRDNFVIKVDSTTGFIDQTLSWGSTSADYVEGGTFDPSNKFLTTFGRSPDTPIGSLTSRYPADTSYDGTIINWNLDDSSIAFSQIIHSTNKQTDYLWDGQWFEDNLYTVGYSAGNFPGHTAQGYDMSMFRHNINGTQIWNEHLGSPSSDFAYSIHVMRPITIPEKNMSLLTDIELENTVGLVRIYVALRTLGNFPGSSPPNNGSYDGSIACYTENGTTVNLEWVRNVGGEASDYAQSVIADPWGNSFIAGYTYSSVTFNGIPITSTYGTDIFVVKYDIDGNLLWTFLQQYEGYAYAFSQAIHFQSGTVIVAGYHWGPYPGAKYNPAQNEYVPIFIRYDPDNPNNVYEVFNIPSSPGDGDLYAYGVTVSEAQGIQLVGAANKRVVPGDPFPDRGSGSFNEPYLMRFGGNLEYIAPPVKKKILDVPFDWELFLAIFIPAFVVSSAIVGLIVVNRRQKQQLVLEQERVRNAYSENPGTNHARGQTTRGFVSNFKQFTRTGDVGALFGGRRRVAGSAGTIYDDEEAVPLTAQNSDPPLRLLSMDGGGIRGLALLTMIDVITQEAFEIPAETENQRVWQLFDFVAGSSTGGILTLALFVKKLSIVATHDLYISLGNRVFKKSKMAKLKQITGKGLYGNKLHSFLEKYFGLDPMVGRFPDQLPPYPRVFSVTANANDDPPSSFLIRNYSHDNAALGGVGFVGSDQFQLFQAAVATSAAPTFFDIYSCTNPQTGHTFNFADGSIITNNPCRMLLYECKRVFPSRKISVILSLGTGSIDTLSSHATASGAERSALGWAKTMAKLVTSSQTVHEDMLRDFAERDIYFRLSPHFKQESDSFEFQMDDARPKTIERIVNGTKYYMCTGDIALTIKSLGRKLMSSRNEKEILQRIELEKSLGLDTWKESLTLSEQESKPSSRGFGFGKKRNQPQNLERSFPVDDISSSAPGTAAVSSPKSDTLKATMPSFSATVPRPMKDSDISLFPTTLPSGSIRPTAPRKLKTSYSVDSQGSSLSSGQVKTSYYVDSQSSVSSSPLASRKVKTSYSVDSTSSMSSVGSEKPKYKSTRGPSFRPKPKPANPLGFSDRSSIMTTTSRFGLDDDDESITSSSPSIIGAPSPNISRISKPKPTRPGTGSGTPISSNSPKPKPKPRSSNAIKPKPKPRSGSKPKPKPKPVGSPKPKPKPVGSPKPKPRSLSKPKPRSGSKPRTPRT